LEVVAKTTFRISLIDSEIPVSYSDGGLEDFRLKTAPVFDREMTRHLLTAFAAEGNPPPVDPLAAEHRGRHLRLMGPQIYQGLTSGNTSKVVLCVMWLGCRYPDITGLAIDGSTYRFTSDTEQDLPAHLFQSADKTDSTSSDQ